MIINTGIQIIHIDMLFAAVALLLICVLSTRRRQIPRGLRLPPGPPGKALVGNVADMPTQQEWFTCSQWAKKYGDMIYIKVLGQPMMVASSMEITFDLFEKRSSIYSDRCEFPMLIGLMGFGWHFAFMRYGDWWRRHRKIFHQKFHPTAVINYQSVQIRQTRALLWRFYESPDDFVEHLRHTAGAIIMEFIYGIKVLPTDDPYVITAEKALAGATTAGHVGAFFVDVLPILKYVPQWMPGAGFQQQARIWRQSITEMSVAPFLAVKSALLSGTATPSFTSSLLEDTLYREDIPPDEEDVIRGAGSTVYAAGADTSVSALHTFMLGMVLSPQVQRKAQEELDNVLEPDRLPEFEDRGNLPYINAVCKEVLRWQPVVPLGVAHRVTQDDIYGEYFIPEGTLVGGNTWHMLHDEKIFGPDTHEFKPERFLVPGIKDPDVAFGYGRRDRICPGRYMADNSVFIAVASILKIFDIAPAYDNKGKEIAVSPSFTSGFMSHPETFQCTIRPRSDAAEKLLQHIEE